jgi:hypothetical protein
VKRPLLIGLASALLATGLAGSAPGLAATDKGETCAKVRHSKIVWVKVKRKGKIVKVKRKKVWWTCDPYEAAGPPRLGVVAREFRLTFTRPYVKSGKLILELNNQGEDVHNLRIARGSGGPALTRVDDTLPRQQKTIQVALKPGTYRLWCALPSHARLGMKTRLKVVAPNR